MLFNSVEFLFLFLPITLVLFHFLRVRISSQSALYLLICSSLFFYAWWQPIYLLLLGSSILVNFCIANAIYRYRKSWLTILGVCLNLAAIGYYKYSVFFVNNLALLYGSNWQIEQILLPLAISFFTFQQIAYLIDVQRHQVIEPSFSNYVLFVCFFPQLIAGPIVHHSEMMPQFRQGLQISSRHFAVGFSIFCIGLFKKTVLADGIAVYANPVFLQAEQGVALDFFTAWGGALAYTFQLYFDFSGYSDMAIGLALLFGIALPLNFNSPYKALNIVDFWRRWHITLSRFLRDYLYISLGGNRFGFIRRYSNLFITMLLGGLWHGAGWNFLIWGALHGSYLVINHGFTHIRQQYLPFINDGWFAPIAWTITFVAVVVGWVFFRAESLDGALLILSAMTGANGISLPAGLVAQLDFLSPLLQWLNVKPYLGGGMLFVETWVWITILLLLSVLLPNVLQLFYTQLPEQTRKGVTVAHSAIQWRPSLTWAAIISLLLIIALSTLGRVSEFLYFNF
ncbi:MBOAT family O-acyltransferase [Alishewanella tabrizica]|uniref:Probable alginate O-acetylase n=1 Tax=Alishewanella tabrizica TaxID=671278 RepID=A0ABQ2WPW7_9ALTE|nr:MBOAT family protein [Alishewanella tabrizica]GGW62768.1 alginate O-acetylation protein [Alishewanella tabrizica]